MAGSLPPPSAAHQMQLAETAGLSQGLPPIDPAAHYDLLALNAMTEVGMTVSLQVGGIAYEDPVWALIVAASIGRGTPSVVPRAPDAAALWPLAAETLVGLAQTGEVAATTLAPAIDFLAAALPRDPDIAPISGPRFYVIQVQGEHLLALRDAGMQALPVTRPPRFFQLFQKS